jgi:spore maturation protein CgeB
MKIVMVGYHNPNFINSIVYREKALKDLGHQLIAFDESAYIFPGRVRQALPIIQKWDLEKLNKRLIDLVKREKPDLCIVVGGHTILPSFVSKIKGMKVPIALWTTDVPVHFENILACAPFYTHLFCAGSEAMDIFHEKGFENTTWLPFGCDADFHKPVTLDSKEHKEYARDVVFVGSYYPNRAIILEAIADLNVGVWGPYWEKLQASSPLKNKAINIKMNYDEWVKIFSACKINLVIHYNDGKVPCHQASPKIFEALACGCFVLTDRQRDVENLFKDKEHLVFFDNEQDLQKKIQYYLEQADERNRIALKGQASAINEHTYKHRMKRLIEVLYGA